MLQLIATMSLSLHRRSSARPRGAFTIVEIAVGASLFMMILAIIYAFWVGTSTSTTKSVEHSDALRSVMIVSEAIRRDVSQMLFQKPDRDLAVFDDGKSLSLRIPSQYDASDLWHAVHSPVTYTLQPASGSAGARFVVRKDTQRNEERPLRSCLVQDMLFMYQPRGTASQLQSYLDITVIGMGSPKGKATYTGSMIIPLPLMGAPGKYRLKFQQGGP